ncbi:Sensor protein ZraS [Anaerohalosphaera lusitana]|uniref:histidine kinase n=1 Tax=Anaerohalosphaera lusitana TaxID=1936003 RepID=A0A1U9NHD6_9BACT|nr:ATP-binding protein [Anaerohalosphaera lusitana]AQT67178.1 Sensor protein ZraS [Anaerohalosphaera lusitana]
MASLQIIAGPWRDTRFELADKGTGMLVGRENGHIAMHDVRVSRKHARLRYEDGWYLRDLDSTNGTFVNEKRLRGEIKLEHNDQVRFGSTFLLFEDEEAERPMIEVEPVGGVSVEEDAAGETVVGFDVGQDGGDLLSEKLGEKIGEVVNASKEREELLGGSVGAFVEELGAVCGFVLVRDFDSGRLETAAEKCSGEHEAGEVRIDSGIVEEVLGGEAVVVGDMDEYKQSSLGRVKVNGAKSVLCVPVRAGKSVVGALYLASDEVAAFTEKQAKVCEQVAGEVGLAMENIRLSKEIEKRERVAAAGQTAVNLSHGVKNLLQAIGGASDVMDVSLEREDWKRAKRSWKVLRRNLGRINKLVLDMLEYTKESSPVLSGCDLDGLVRSAVEAMEDEAKEKGVKLEFAEDAKAGVVQLDADKMHDVVLNLVLNAIDAVAKDEGEVRVETGRDEGKGEVWVSVADNGCGVENAEAIFLPFHTSKTKVGTGLGLPIAKKIVEQHGGRIEVESEKGAGARFVVRLPLRR